MQFNSLVTQSVWSAAPSLLVPFPLGHWIHDVLFAVGWYVPLGHAKHVAKPSLEYVPGGQISKVKYTKVLQTMNRTFLYRQLLRQFT